MLSGARRLSRMAFQYGTPEYHACFGALPEPAAGLREAVLEKARALLSVALRDFLSALKKRKKSQTQEKNQIRKEKNIF